MKALAIPAILLAATAAAHGEAASMRLGSIAIDYDPARWEAIAGPPGDRETRIFRCLGADCRRIGGDTPVVAVYRSESGSPTTEVPAERQNWRDVVPLWDEAGAERTFGGVRFTAYAAGSRCRAYVPSELRAIGTLGSRSYVFSSGFNAGCIGRANVGRERFEELLEGVRAVEDGAK